MRTRHASSARTRSSRHNDRRAQRTRQPVVSSLLCRGSLLGAENSLAAGGGTCTASGTGNIADTVNLPAGGSVAYTVAANVAPGATGTLANTVTISAPAGVTDTSPANNAATDTDTLAAAPTIVQPIPALGGGVLALLVASLSAPGAFFVRRRHR